MHILLYLSGMLVVILLGSALVLRLLRLFSDSSAPGHAVARADHAAGQPHRLAGGTPACAQSGLCLRHASLGCDGRLDHFAPDRGQYSRCT